MSKISVISKAWFEVVKGNTTKEHKRRSDICDKCKLKEYKTILDFINDELVNIKGFRCGVCKCPLAALIRSEDTCEKGYWDINE